MHLPQVGDYCLGLGTVATAILLAKCGQARLAVTEVSWNTGQVSCNTGQVGSDTDRVGQL